MKGRIVKQRPWKIYLSICICPVARWTHCRILSWIWTCPVLLERPSLELVCHDILRHKDALPCETHLMQSRHPVHKGWTCLILNKPSLGCEHRSYLELCFKMVFRKYGIRAVCGSAGNVVALDSSVALEHTFTVWLHEVDDAWHVPIMITIKTSMLWQLAYAGTGNQKHVPIFEFTVTKKHVLVQHAQTMGIGLCCSWAENSSSRASNAGTSPSFQTHEHCCISRCCRPMGTGTSTRWKLLKIYQ